MGRKGMEWGQGVYRVIQISRGSRSGFYPDTYPLPYQLKVRSRFSKNLICIEIKSVQSRGKVVTHNERNMWSYFNIPTLVHQKI